MASVFNVQAVQQGKADVAFTQGDVAYFAYRRGTEADSRPHTKLRGIAVLWVNTVQLVVPRDSDIDSVGDFRGRRVGVGSPASGTADCHAAGHRGRTVSATRRSRSEPLSFSEAVGRMQDKTLDAAFVVASYPVSAVSEMNTAFGVRLIPVAPAVVDRIRTDYPFIKPMLIPSGTYAGQDRDLDTLGVDNILVCRDDLPEDLVYRLTKVLYESLNESGRQGCRGAAHRSRAGTDHTDPSAPRARNASIASARYCGDGPPAVRIARGGRA